MIGYQLLTTGDAAKLLAITPTHLRDLSTHGDIAYVNVGVGKKREIRRYRLTDIQAFLDDRTLISPVRRSTRAPLEITDEDVLKAAKIVARDRKRREQDLADEAFRARQRQERDAREAWLKRCEEEADVIRERLFIESLKAKGKKPPRGRNAGT